MNDLETTKNWISWEKLYRFLTYRFPSELTII
jgi:hypothetical protein